MGATRVLIADDEPLARQRLRTLAAREADVVVVGECATGRAATEILRRQAADIAFLDVQMPDGDGFDVIREVGADRMPAARPRGWPSCAWTTSTTPRPAATTCACIAAASAT